MSEVKQFVASEPRPFQKEEAKRLLELLQEYEKVYTFAVRQLVQYKPGLAMTELPVDGQPAVVLEVLSPPEVFFTDSSWQGTGVYRLPVDVVVGVLDKSGRLVRVHLDSHRLEPWKGGGAE